MRKVIFGGANSLDNYFARADHSVDWLMWSDEVTEIMKDWWPRFDTVVMGRKTWDVATGAHKEGKRATKGKREKGSKPRQSREAKNPYGNMKTIVFSRTLEAGERDGVVFTNADPGKYVADLKKHDGKDICVMGGGELGSALLDARVVDEIGFNIHPVLLGSGIPLFHKMSRQIDLELRECKVMKNGCIYVVYRVK